MRCRENPQTAILETSNPNTLDPGSPAPKKHTVREGYIYIVIFIYIYRYVYIYTYRIIDAYTYVQETPPLNSNPPPLKKNRQARHLGPQIPSQSGCESVRAKLVPAADHSHPRPHFQVSPLPITLNPKPYNWHTVLSLGTANIIEYGFFEVDTGFLVSHYL